MARSRPAQGANSAKPFNRPRPAYIKDASPRVVSQGTKSNPKSPTAGGFKGSRLVADATPRVVQL